MKPWKHYNPYPQAPWYPPPERDDGMDKMFAFWAFMNNAMKEFKEKEDSKKKEEKKPEKKSNFSFLETLGLLMLFGMPVAYMQWKIGAMIFGFH